MSFGPIQKRFFQDINFDNPFFDSLKEDYPEFEVWVERKKRDGDKAFYLEDDNGDIDAFLYLKIEEGPISDITPQLLVPSALKIGTLKVNPHGTRLGERFIKIIINHAIEADIDIIYVTVFAHHLALISLFEEFGFIEYGSKVGEKVYIKKIGHITGDLVKDYPVVPVADNSKYLISIYPDYHTQLFPDSILFGEDGDEIIHDLSHTNSIHKIYLSGSSDSNKIEYGDLIVFYRTSDIPGRAYYRAVATSLCAVEEVRPSSSFSNEDDFVEFCRSYSLFDEGQLRYHYRKNVTAIKFLYITAFKYKVIRKKLLEDIKIPDGRWIIVPLNDSKFNQLISLSGISNKFIS